MVRMAAPSTRKLRVLVSVPGFRRPRTCVLSLCTPYEFLQSRRDLPINVRWTFSLAEIEFRMNRSHANSKKVQRGEEDRDNWTLRLQKAGYVRELILQHVESRVRPAEL